ncbi:SMP-30/gluconolactonase/LRE family protein [Kineosporia mesophila]|uniref:SMP-30/gluconolactonase/LRE family protein n=1 Tax=Kineosporia mesophila TaxID=566012 RepID=A0ABP7AK45_9ACTN|nr:SMP-30/gluconolactonase/LRE family protein [Kineosporia mesophila]MCD5352492.1 SMP-30/gluconolactonase/LRE family protein [Kineosporia mesophila]
MSRGWPALGMVAVLVLSGCGSEVAAGADPDGRRLLKVSDVHEATGMTLLEGPVFTPDGSLLVVDVTAPAGEPKVLTIDVRKRSVKGFLTDASSAWTSAQISPYDGRLYLTDFAAGAIDSISLDGDDPRVFFTGQVDGAVMKPDDLTFDPEGNLYVSDTTGHDEPGGPDQGRIVRIDRDGQEATVLADELPAPNGVSFDATYEGLWISEYSGNRIDRLGLTVGGKAVATQYPAVRVDAGLAQVDSNAVDASGNVYQMFHRQARVMVFGRNGDHLDTIDLPVPDDGDYSATNLAIRPGTKDAYVTVSGPSGGFVYTFRARDRGVRQSNGG